MSLPRFLVVELPTDGRVALDADESRHASQVLRLKVGDRIELFDGRGGSADAAVAEVGKRQTLVQIQVRTDVDRELPAGLELLIALPKGDRQKQLVDALVQLGVRKLTPLSCHRSVAQPSLGAMERLQRTVVESSKQCGRNRLMEIGEPLSLEVLPQHSSGTTLCWFAHPYGNPQSLAAVEPGIGLDVDAVRQGVRARAIVGPEGGLTAAEVEGLTAAGWQQVSLGTRILRVELAATTIAAWWSLRWAG
jgi:16S rRNA (uracil1498-N3)-methyltransferase